MKGRSANQRKPPPFRYRHYAALATIGRNSAVIDFGRIRMKGRLAWLIWSMTHIYFLIGARNRLLVTLQWLFDYITFTRGARLIAGFDPVAEQRSAWGGRRLRGLSSGRQRRRERPCRSIQSEAGAQSDIGQLRSTSGLYRDFPLPSSRSRRRSTEPHARRDHCAL